MILADPAKLLKDADERGLRRVLVVTALPLEMSAVRAHLTQLGSCQGRDGGIVEIGQFSAQGDEWLVVVAECGAGTHNAQSAFTYASIDFGPFELSIFVGVAASRKPEAPIGSVVVSNHVYFPYTGKYSGGEFYSRPHTFPADNRLVGLARKIERDEEWPARVKAPLKKKLPDEDQYPKPYPPGAFIAPIISVEAVSADAGSELEMQISKHYGDSLALEMEGYGALFAGSRERTPSIVVRGISDMREGKNPAHDAIYQPVAAAHAAAFGFELLEAWGQSSRPGRTSPDVTANAAPASQTTAANTARPTQLKANFVLNFAGEAADFPQDKIERIVAELRAITGDPDLSLVRTEPGSFRMVIEALAAVSPKLDAPETFEMLSQKFQVRLLGVADESEFQEATGSKIALLEASQPLLDWPQSLPDGTTITRPELDRLLEAAESSESSTIALLGLPGSGKSALLAAFGQRLRERSIPFLAIKADLLDTNVNDEQRLAASIGLFESPTILLTKIARLRPVVLIIDQLDALAGYVDLRTGRLNVLLNIVRKLSGQRNIHIVLSARTFEYEHDARLRTIRSESLTLDLPPWSAVLEILEKNQIKAAGWPANAQEVMRYPQALATFLKMADGKGAQPFSTYQAMLNHLWTELLLKRSDGPRLAELARNIAEQMAELETLWLASSRYDERAGDLDALIATGILTRYGDAGRIGFSHQTVFEHALARAFSQQTGRLSKYVLERESSLFVRPKLWASLTYLREVEPATYHTELSTIWSAPNLRIHLRHLLIEFLGQHNEPDDQEALLIGEALRSEHRRIALQSIIGSAGWFARLEPEIGAAMVAPAESHLAAAILSRAWPEAAEKVIGLIRSRWLPDAKFDYLIMSVFQACPHWTDAMLDIAAEGIARTDISPYEFDHIVGTLGVEQPKAALRLVITRLDTKLQGAVAEANERAREQPPENENERISWRISHSPTEPITRLIESSDGWDSLEALAEANAQVFLDVLWPWFRKATDALRDIADEGDGPGFSLPYALDFRFDGESPLDLPERPILGALRTAAEKLAKSDEAGFCKWLNANQDDDSTPAQRLFAHALSTQPEKYADRALAFLLDDPNRFHLTGIEAYASTAKKLVHAVSPYWSDAQIEIFSNAVLSYAPKPRSGLHAKGRLRFGQYIRVLKTELLEALPSDRTSKAVQSFIAEERRLHPQDRQARKIYGARYIGSPISKQSLARASDDEIINAFKNLPDASGWDNPKDWMKGGNIQLSREFAEFSKEHIERAARIIRKFEPVFGTRAAGYALDAMAETAPAQLICELITELEQSGFAGGEYRGNIASAIERLVRRELAIDERIVVLLENWLSSPFQATEDRGPEDNEDATASESAEDTADKSERSDSILWGMGGIFVLPGGNYPVLRTLITILLERKDYARTLAILASHLDAGDDQRVWQALLHYMPFVHTEPFHELTDFLGRLFAHYPNLLRTHEAMRLLGQIHWQAPDFAGSMLKGWVSKGQREEQGYGELVALIALVRPELEWPEPLLAKILSHPELASARVGAAHAAVNVWSVEERRPAASSLLQSIIPVADASAWSAIFDLFRLVDEITPDAEWIDLLKAIERHIDNAKAVDSTFVIERLQTLLPHEAALVGRLAKGLVAKWHNDLGDLRTAASSVAPEFVDIAITIHRLGPDTREIGTSLFEDLLQINAYTARNTLDQIDNRFRESSAAHRPRLPRRSSKPRRQKRAA